MVRQHHPKSHNPQQPTFLIVGKPNAGKGAMLEKIEKRYQVITLGTGNICREEKARNTALYKEAKLHMDHTRSTLWPTELIVRAVEEKFSRAVRRGTVALDGFLRDPEQGPHLVRMMQGFSLRQIIIIDVDATDDTCIIRAAERDRDDDKDIHERLQDFHDHTVPAIHQFLASAHIIPVQRVIYDGNIEGYEAMDRFVEGLGFLYPLRVRQPALTASDFHG